MICILTLRTSWNFQNNYIVAKDICSLAMWKSGHVNLSCGGYVLSSFCFLMASLRALDTAFFNISPAMCSGVSPNIGSYSIDARHG